MIKLHHHPYSRAAGVVWMLEEVGQPYELHHVDLRAGDQKQADHLSKNRMGKIPVVEDGDVLISEGAAIGLYLADRYAPGTLAPRVDEADRGPFLRWCFFSPSVIEPAAAANAGNWQTRAGAVGWGRYEDMLDTLETAVATGPWLLGDRFSMADVIAGGTARFLLQFKMLDARPAITAWIDRLNARPAYQRATAVNEKAAREQGLA